MKFWLNYKCNLLFTPECILLKGTISDLIIISAFRYPRLLIMLQKRKALPFKGLYKLENFKKKNIYFKNFK